MGKSQNTAAPADRFLIRSTATGASDGDSMQNLNSAVLPDGALCFVIATASMYYLDKTAVTGGISPSSGPGQWRVFSVAAAASRGAEVDSTDFNSFAVDGNWHATTSSSSRLVAVVSGPDWALTPTGALLTYTGPDRTFLVTLAASAKVGDASVGRDVFLGIDKSGDMTGAPTQAVGVIDQVASVAGADYAITTTRLVAMSSGGTIQPKMAAPSGAVSLQAGFIMTVAPA